MALPLTEAFSAGAGNLANPPWTQAALSATRLNYDGSGHGKASAADASFDVIAYDNSNIYSANQYAKVTVGGLGVGSYCGLIVHASGTSTTFKGYELLTDGTAGAGHTEIFRYNAGVGTSIVNFAGTISNGDTIELRIVDAVLSFYKNGVLVGTFNDSASLVVGGAAGASVFNTTNNALLTNWEGGDLGVLVGSTGTRRAFGGRGQSRAINSPSGPFDQRGFLKQRLWDYTLLVVAAGISVNPGIADLQFAGLAPTVQVSNNIAAAPSVGSLTLAGLAPTVSLPQTVNPSVGSLVFTGLAPSVVVGTNAQPGVGALTLSGLAPTVLTPRAVTPGIGALTFTGLAPTVFIGTNAFPAVGQLSLTGLAPTVLTPVVASPAVGALSLTGLAPQVQVGVNVSPSVGSAVFTGLAPTVLTPARALPSVGQLAVTGFAPTVTVSSLAAIHPAVGQLVFTGYAPVIGTFVFGTVQGGPVMSASINAGGVLTARITTGPVLTETITGGPV